MPPFRNILVAADFSKGSREAFRVACSLAHEDETRIHVLNVMEPKYEVETPVYHSDKAIHYSRVERDPSEHVSMRERLREAYAPDRPLDVAYQTKEGDAAEEVLRALDENGCDLVVMGTHGRTGLGRRLVGSVAESVMRKSKCPVLSVRTSSFETAPAPEAPHSAVVKAWRSLPRSSGAPSRGGWR